MGDPHAERLHGVAQTIRVRSNVGCKNSQSEIEAGIWRSYDHNNRILGVEAYIKYCICAAIWKSDGRKYLSILSAPRTELGGPVAAISAHRVPRSAAPKLNNYSTSSFHG